MTEKKYGMNFRTPNWRLYDLESGKIIVQAENGYKFWDTVVKCKGINLTEIKGFYLD